MALFHAFPALERRSSQGITSIDLAVVKRLSLYSSYELSPNLDGGLMDQASAISAWLRVRKAFEPVPARSEDDIPRDACGW